MTSVMADELRAIRHLGQHELDPGEWTTATQLTSTPTTTDTLELDSLEWLSVASRVIQFFNLQDSGYEDYLLRKKSLGEWVEIISQSRGELDETVPSLPITFQTSGSSGSPKACQHNWDSLVGEAEAILTYLTTLYPASGIQRIVALTPCHHIYGFLFSILLPRLAQHLFGHPVTIARGFKAFSLVQQERLQAGDLVIGVPYLWQQFTQRGLRFPAQVVGLTSTGPCPADVQKQLRSQGLEHLVEIYGSSETAGIGLRDSFQQPYELLHRWQTKNDYLTDRQTGESFPLMDKLSWLSPTQFEVLGRQDEAVQVAGHNVYPAAIAEQLASHPWVAYAAVRLMQPQEGARLKAFIVASPEAPIAHSELTKELHRWCQTNLSTPQRPKHFTFGNELPRNAMGKAADWTISLA